MIDARRRWFGTVKIVSFVSSIKLLDRSVNTYYKNKCLLFVSWSALKEIKAARSVRNIYTREKLDTTVCNMLIERESL